MNKVHDFMTVNNEGVLNLNDPFLDELLEDIENYDIWEWAYGGTHSPFNNSDLMFFYHNDEFPVLGCSKVGYYVSEGHIDDDGQTVIYGNMWYLGCQDDVVDAITNGRAFYKADSVVK